MLLSIGFISLSLETREGANLFVLVKFVNLKYSEFAKSRIPPIYVLSVGAGRFNRIFSPIQLKMNLETAGYPC